jgi:hypothetical protein
MVLARRAGLMELNTRASMTKGGNMGKANLFSPRKVTMRVNLTKTRYAVRASTTGLMENSSLGNGLKIRCTGLANLAGLTVAHTKEILFKISVTGRAPWFGRTVAYIRGSGQMVSRMVLEFIQSPMAQPEKESGTTGRE